MVQTIQVMKTLKYHQITSQFAVMSEVWRSPMWVKKSEQPSHSPEQVELFEYPGSHGLNLERNTQHEPGYVFYWSIIFANLAKIWMTQLEVDLLIYVICHLCQTNLDIDLYYVPINVMVTCCTLQPVNSLSPFGPRPRRARHARHVSIHGTGNAGDMLSSLPAMVNHGNYHGKYHDPMMMINFMMISVKNISNHTQSTFPSWEMKTNSVGYNAVMWLSL